MFHFQGVATDFYGMTYDSSHGQKEALVVVDKVEFGKPYPNKRSFYFGLWLRKLQRSNGD